MKPDDSLDHGQDRSDRQGGADCLDYVTIRDADGNIVFVGPKVVGTEEDEILGIATGEKFKE